MLDIKYASIMDIHRALLEKKITVRSLILTFLSRIEKIDSCPDGLKSVIEINPDVLFIANELDCKLDKLLNEGDELAPLFGIPVLLKDNINTADKLHTSAGSVALADSYAQYDAYLVSCLRKAGAIILGKTNITEFANYMSSGVMPSGYSSRGGKAVNPYNKYQTPGGSSSGSAVAVAAGLCTVSIGTETSGSIISPAGQNGIVGIKPTLGLVGRSGIIPISNTLDIAGPMARTVRDVAVLLSVIAGADPVDAATHSIKGELPTDYTRYLEKDGHKGARIGISRPQNTGNNTQTEEDRAAFDNLCKVVTDAGAIVIDNINIDFTCNIRDIMRYEFKSSINYYLSTLKGNTNIKTLKDIIDYNNAQPEIALRYGQNTLLDTQINTSGTLTEPEYIKALEAREKAIVDLDKVFEDNTLDIILCDSYTNIAPFTGFPSITVPIGQRKDKLPIASYWIARRFDEAALLKVTYAVEQLMTLSLKPDVKGKKK